ncbi:MAG: MogA/MoaB family molybdenum cofactor biosynthesis protein [Thermoleophilia bacterium]
MSYNAAVLTVSDKGAGGEREDISGALLARLLEEHGAVAVRRLIVPDEHGEIVAALRQLCQSGADLILTTGGTGLAPRDVTPEATLEVVTRAVPGISEAIRAASWAKTPRAMLSRGVSGIHGGTLIINFPGSPVACAESFAVIGPVLAHALEVLAGDASDCAAEKERPADG